MRIATLLSNPSTEYGTFGTILLDDHTSWSTGELPWADNQHGISCIPAGTYTCKWINSPKHGMCYQVMDVPNRDMIEIHSANFPPQQLLGCIGLGESIGLLAPYPGAIPVTAILQSKQAVQEFEDNLKTEDFQLTVIRK